MNTAISSSMLAGNIIPYAFKNGSTGISGPEERRTYEHVINVLIGNFPWDGLTGSLSKSDPRLAIEDH